MAEITTYRTHDESGHAFVAVAFEKSGEVYDHLYTWETGQTYANDGYRVLALTGDGHLSREEAQGMYDRELAAALDCFGPEHAK